MVSNFPRSLFADRPMSWAVLPGLPAYPKSVLGKSGLKKFWTFVKRFWTCSFWRWNQFSKPFKSGQLGLASAKQAYRRASKLSMHDLNLNFGELRAALSGNFGAMHRVRRGVFPFEARNFSNFFSFWTVFRPEESTSTPDRKAPEKSCKLHTFAKFIGNQNFLTCLSFFRATSRLLAGSTYRVGPARLRAVPSVRYEVHNINRT